MGLVFIVILAIAVALAYLINASDKKFHESYKSKKKELEIELKLAILLQALSQDDEKHLYDEQIKNYSRQLIEIKCLDQCSMCSREERAEKYQEDVEEKSNEFVDDLREAVAQLDDSDAKKIVAALSSEKYSTVT